MLSWHLSQKNEIKKKLHREYCHCNGSKFMTIELIVNNFFAIIFTKSSLTIKIFLTQILMIWQSLNINEDINNENLQENKQVDKI